MLTTAILFIAQAAPPTVTPKAPDSGLQMMGMMLFAFAMIYFITIRPQQKRQKALQDQVNATKTGDRVITASGIHGMISNVKERTFILKVADNVKIEIEKSSVASILKASEGSSPESGA